MTTDLWSSSGARALTAHSGAPPGDPAAQAAEIGQRITRLSHGTVAIDGAAELTLREHLSTHQHTPTAGRTLRGAGQMLRCADGWVALQLPRTTDRELIPALTDGAVSVPPDPTQIAGAFDELQQWLRSHPRAPILERARLLSLPCAAVPAELRSPSTTPRVQPWQLNTAHAARHTSQPLVVDLSSLWAGPLAGAILAASGASVLRVQDEQRAEKPLPSDARFYARLNQQKEHRLQNFDDLAGLQRLVSSADVLITSARTRALTRLGILPTQGQIWLRISAAGATGAAAHTVGFGDDAAAAAGAVSWHHGQPSFVADALADPLTGMLAAEAALTLLRTHTAGIVDLDLRRSASWAIHRTGSGQ